MLLGDKDNEVEYTKSTWWKAVELAQSKEFRSISTVYGTMLQLQLCPLDLVDNEMNQIMRVHTATGGIKNIRTPEEYLSLPAFWITCVDIIESEIAIFKRLKALEDA